MIRLRRLKIYLSVAHRVCRHRTFLPGQSQVRDKRTGVVRALSSDLEQEPSHRQILHNMSMSQVPTLVGYIKIAVALLSCSMHLRNGTCGMIPSEEKRHISIERCIPGI